MSATPSGSGPERQTFAGRPVRRAVGRARLRQTAGLLAIAGAVLGLSAAAWTVPQVRNELRDSFTERQQAYLELSFAQEPWFDGKELVVPLAVVEHGDTGGRHELRAWVQNAHGKRLVTRTTTVTTKPGALISTDVRLRIKGSERDADLVEVTLPGHPQRLRMHLS